MNTTEMPASESHPKDDRASTYRQVSATARSLAFVGGLLWSGAVCWALIQLGADPAESGPGALRFLLTLTAGAGAVLAGQPLMELLAHLWSRPHLSRSMERSYLSGAGASAMGIILAILVVG